MDVVERLAEDVVERPAEDVVERLGELLRQAGFPGERAFDLLHNQGGMPPADALAAVGRPDDSRLAALLALFHHGRRVPEPQAEQAIGAETLDQLRDAGLVKIEDSSVRTGLDLAFFEGLILAGDRGEREFADLVKNHSEAGRTVARLTVRLPIRSALDLGTGSGVQALLAARHADRVIGVDLNRRALSFARLNQRLNGVDGVTWMEGSWTEPVRGQRFDLVTANPPFVMSPDKELVYRDSPSRGDELSRRVVRESAEHLAEGGFATVLCNSIHGEGDTWETPLLEWVAGLGCDAVLVHLGTHEPLVYATYWNGSLLADDPDRFDQTVSRWVDYYKRARVERIAYAAIVLRRRSGASNWTRALPAERIPNGAGGAQLERIFAGGNFLAAHSGAEQLRRLLSTPWRLVDGHRLDQTQIHEGGEYATGYAVIKQDPGPGLDAHLDPRVVPVLIECNGERPLGRLIEQSPIPEGLDRAGFHSLCLEAVRTLIARGFVVGDALPDAAAQSSRA